MTNSTTKLVVSADIFIIPNGLTRLDSEWYTEKYPEYRAEYLKQQEELNLEPSTELVQVWVTNSDCENFDCKGHKGLLEAWKNKKSLNNYRFPSNLPTNLFEGKKEGDIVVIDTPEARVELKLNQLNYRYGSHGTFEDVLARLKSIS